MLIMCQAKHVRKSLSFYPYNNPMRYYYYYPHLIDKGIEV